MRSIPLARITNPVEHDPYYEEGVGDFNLDRLKHDRSWLAAAWLTASPKKKSALRIETEVFYSMMDSLNSASSSYGPTWTLYGASGNRRDDQRGHRLGSDRRRIDGSW